MGCMEDRPSPDGDTDARERGAWRDPWPGRVRPCDAELAIVDRLRTEGEVYPARDLETEALRRLAFDDVRVVLVGIDPYPNAAHATGLAFSVPPGTRPLPPGVRNLRKAAAADGWTQDAEHPLDGDLSGWVEQGVLLLNRALTFSRTNGRNVAGVHLPIWQGWTDSVITALDRRKVPPVFVLMGAKAKKVAPLIERAKDRVVLRAHPSAPGLQNRFVGSALFREIDGLLTDKIDWRR